jgi:hypothetical protein
VLLEPLLAPLEPLALLELLELLLPQALMTPMARTASNADTTFRILI